MRQRQDDEKGGLVYLRVLSSVLSIALAVNVFFVKRLVDKIDVTSEDMASMKKDFAVLKVSFDFLSKRRGCQTIPSDEVKLDAYFQKRFGDTYGRIGYMDLFGFRLPLHPEGMLDDANRLGLSEGS